MTRFYESSPDDRLLEWSLHPLSDVMRALGSPELELSPTLHPAGSFPERRLVSGEDPHRVFWAWGGWERVEARPFSGRGDAVARSRHALESSVMSWSTLSFCDAVELTPYDARGEAGVTVRRERPMILISEDIQYQRRGSVLKVRLLSDGQRESLGVRLVNVWGQVGDLVRFDGDGVAVIHLNGFHGHVAVVHHREGVERLMHCKSWVPKAKEFREVGEEGRDIVRKMIEGEREGGGVIIPTELHGWLNQWPHRSRNSLHGIYKTATRLLSPDDLVGHFKQSLSGLFRLLVLLRCGLRGGPPPDLLIAHLNEGAWNETLRRLSPHLPEAIAGAKSIAEKEWAVAHALAPGLRDAVTWAGGSGVAALDRALGLVELRARTASLGARLRPESEEGQEVSLLLEEIEQSPFRVAPTATLHERFESLDRRVGLKEGMSLNPDELPPPSHDGYLRWRAKCQLRRHWRSELARVLSYSEKGEWPPAEDPARDVPEINVGGLLRRLDAVETPKISSLHQAQPSVGAEVGEVVECIKRLIDEREHETFEALRMLARDRLTYVISPNVTLWAPLHQELRQIEQQAPQFPWFAAQAGLVGQGLGLNARIDPALKFLKMLEALERRVNSWKGKGPAGDKAKLREVLTSPAHPHVAEMHAKAWKLLLALASTEYTNDIQLAEQPPAPPTEASEEKLNLWWDTIRDIELTLFMLESRMSRLRTEAKWFNEQLGWKVKALLRYWQERRPGERPDYYTQLERLHALCAAPSELEPANFQELIELLNTRLDWRRNWERITRR